MNGSYSPAVLYLTDDDTDTEENNEQPNGLVATSSTYHPLPRKKRNFLDGSVRHSPVIVNGNKRQRSEILHSRPTCNQDESETILIDADDSIPVERESHSFDVFDWTNDYSASCKTQSNLSSARPPLNVRNFLTLPSESRKIHSAIPVIPSGSRCSATSTKSATSPLPLPLPLPKPTYSISHAIPSRPPPLSRVQAAKHVSIPFKHSSSSTVPAAPPVEFASPSSFPSRSEVHRPTLNGTENVSAFFDANSYQCNICKFHAITSSALLQHLFTHMFVCEQCSFYTYSHHSFCQHTFEKHRPPTSNDQRDPRSFDLLFVTRRADGTFALCTDPSEKKDSLTVVPPKTPSQRKPVKRKNARKKAHSSPVVTSAPTKKESVAHAYIFMKHRRSYSSKQPTSLHSLSAEYQICREHTIRHMSHTQKTLKRRKTRQRINTGRSIDLIGECLKGIVNSIVSDEDSDSTTLLWPIPTAVLDSIFPDNHLAPVLTSLRLKNKYKRSLEQMEYVKAERSYRASERHIFLLSPPETSKTEQSIFASIKTSVTNDDSPWMQTQLNALPISLDNTHRFLKGFLNLPSPRANSISKSASATNAETIPVSGSPSLRRAHAPVLIGDQPVPVSRSSPSPCVIVLD